MYKRFLVAASAIALLSSPAIAADPQAEGNNPGTTQTGNSISEDVKQGWENTKSAAKDAYEDIKATLVDDTNQSGTSTVTVSSRSTASGIIGQPVMNTKGERIASVNDIILDANGNATLVVLADGGFMGIGTKLAAFDYNLVSQRQKDGDIIMPISEETLDKVMPFSFDQADADKDEKVQVPPADSISLAKLLDGHILNERNEAIAEIENISLRNGAADQVIIAFDQTLGLGGEKAAMDFDNLKLIRNKDNKDDLDFQLSAKQASNFEAFKKTSTN